MWFKKPTQIRGILSVESVNIICFVLMINQVCGGRMRSKKLFACINIHFHPSPLSSSPDHSHQHIFQLNYLIYQIETCVGILYFSSCADKQIDTDRYIKYIDVFLNLGILDMLFHIEFISSQFGCLKFIKLFEQE